MKKFLTLVTLVATACLQAQEPVKLQYLPYHPITQDVTFTSTFSGGIFEKKESIKMKGTLMGRGQYLDGQQTGPFALTYNLKKFESSYKKDREDTYQIKNYLFGRSIPIVYDNKLVIEKVPGMLQKALLTTKIPELLQKTMDYTFLMAGKRLEEGRVWLIEDENIEGILKVKELTATEVFVGFEMKERKSPGKLQETKVKGFARYDLDNAYVHEIKIEGKTKNVELFKEIWKLTIRSTPKQ